MKLFSNRLSGTQTLSLAIALMLVVTAAKAATVTITGTMPTQNTDNSTIPATGAGSLSNVRLEYGTCNGTAFGTKVGEVSRAPTAPGAAFSYTLNLDPGTSCVRVLVSNTYGKESDPSNVTTRSVDPPTPKPPVLTSAPLSGLEIPLDSLDGFKRTPVFTITASGPGVLVGFCKAGTPSVQDNLFTYRGDRYCKPLLNHPRTGAPNIAWIKGATPSPDVATPCA